MRHITKEPRLNAMAEYCKKTYGYDEQDYCLTEECGEVIQLLMKLQRSDISDDKKEYLIKSHLPEEIGQVLYMIDGILDKYHLHLEDCGRAVKDRFFEQFGIEDPIANCLKQTTQYGFHIHTKQPALKSVQQFLKPMVDMANEIGKPIDNRAVFTAYNKSTGNMVLVETGENKYIRFVLFNDDLLVDQFEGDLRGLVVVNQFTIKDVMDIQ